MTGVGARNLAALSAAQPKTPPAGMQALGRLKTGEMNGTEKRYAEHLEARKQAGEILWWVFEAITFKLADDCRYTPDFLVLYANGNLEAREVKGFWTDDGRVKIKVAADKFPIRFVAVKALPKREGGGWAEEEF